MEEELKLDLLLFVICMAGVLATMVLYELLQYLSLRKATPAEERRETLAAFKRNLNLKKLLLIASCLSCLLASAWVTKDLSRFLALITSFCIIFLLLLGGRKKQP